MNSKHDGFAISVTKDEFEKLSHRARLNCSYIEVDFAPWKKRYVGDAEYILLKKSPQGFWVPKDEGDIKLMDSFDLERLIEMNAR